MQSSAKTKKNLEHLIIMIINVSFIGSSMCTTYVFSKKMKKKTLDSQKMSHQTVHHNHHQ
jgi:flagellar basal body-associated protein FliL